MKRKLLVLASLVTLGLGANAQTGTGFTIIPTVGVTDVRTHPLNSYRGHNENNVNLGTEVGYFGDEFGLTATVQSNWDLNQNALVGLKAYANIVKFENISLKAAFGAGTYINNPKSDQWLFKPEVSLSIPLVDHFDARFAAIGTFYGNQNWKVYPGGAFGLAYHF